MFPFQQPSWDFVPASSPSLESYLTRNRKEEKKLNSRQLTNILPTNAANYPILISKFKKQKILYITAHINKRMKEHKIKPLDRKLTHDVAPIVIKWSMPF